MPFVNTQCKMSNVYLYISLFLFVRLLSCSTIPHVKNYSCKYKNEQAVRNLQEYIRIDTSSSKNIEQAADFWSRQAAGLGLPFAVYRPSKLPICVITLRGRQPNLPSIMLNSHSDVVPVEADLWTYPPFSANIDDKGNMYGRGTLDCKSTGIQYLEAIRKIICKNITLERTVHITVMPDEETGGLNGMKSFLETMNFKSLNVGFALDEGVPSRKNEIYAIYRDKRPWQMKFTLRGTGGHGAILSNDSVITQVQTLIDTALAYRNRQVEIMQSRPPLDYGSYTSLSVNIIQGGIAPNVVPSRMTVVIDTRLAVEQNVSEFQSMIDTWMSKLGRNTTLEFLRRINSSEATTVDNTNPYWVAMRQTFSDLGLTLIPIVCPASSDMLPLRALDIPAIGFTPTRNTTTNVHNIDEYIPVQTFLNGIDIYTSLIQTLGNLP